DSAILYFCFFFFFSSRRRHTRSLRDWSSDVCSSDLLCPVGEVETRLTWARRVSLVSTSPTGQRPTRMPRRAQAFWSSRRRRRTRSEERRVGKECRCRGARGDVEKNK